MAKWRDILGSLAPTLATAVGGPLAGAATKVIVDALGLPADSTEAQIEKAMANLTPDAVIALKKANNDFAIEMRRLDVNLEEIAFKQSDSARNMQIQRPAKTPAVLSWIVVISTMALEGGILYWGMPVGVPEVVVGRILGTFDTGFGIVLTFWLGAAHRDPTNRGKV